MKSKISEIKVPHAFIFLSGIILFCALLTYIIPSGEYQRKTVMHDHVEQHMIVPGSYSHLPKQYSLEGIILGKKVEGKANPTSVLGLFSSIPKGMNQAAALIFFVFIIGAVFNIIQHTGTISVVMFRLMKRFKETPLVLFFSIYTVIYAGAAFLGMGAEFIPLIPIFLLIAKQTGYDRVFGIALFIIPSYVGWTGALTNPFNVQIAQKVAELPIGSGMGLRIIVSVIFFVLGFYFLMRYGNLVKNKVKPSLMPDDTFELPEVDPVEDKPFERKHFYIMISSAVLFATILYGVQALHWGLIEMSGGFFMVGLSAILFGKMSGNEAMKAFTRGLELMIVPALIIGFARGIQVVLTEAQIVDTILNQTALLLEQMPHLVAIEGMFVFQSVLNFFIPSASGQALVSMPLMVPLSDLLQFSRQSSVLTFVLGDGLSNLIVPTNGELMAILGIASVPFEKWFKFVFPLFVILTILSGIILLAAVYFGY
jgi:uncharacterized ion transporter superfamily protein YfcC